MAETTEEYRNRINQLKTSIENEPYIKKMREDIAEGISKTGNRQADIEVRQDKLEDDFVVVQQDARSNTPSGAELAVAAGSYNTLGERLDAEQNEINAQLGQKADEKEIYEKVKATSAPSSYAGPVFTVVDDDTPRNFLDMMKPILDQRGIKVTLGVITNNVGKSGYLTKDELLQLQAEGHEIVSHSTDHTNIYTGATGVTNKQIEDSLKDSQQWLIDNGFKGYDTFVLPYGSSNDNAKRLMRKYYSHAIESGGGAITKFPYNNMAVPREGIRDSQDFETHLKPIIDDCIANNGWLIFLTHSGYEVTAPLLNETFDYIKSYPVVPFGEALKYKGNALSIGDYNSKSNFFVSSNGTVRGQPLQLKSDIIRTPDHFTKILEAYPLDAITVENIEYSAANPLTEGGVLTTYRTNPYYSYQVFLTVGGIFTRRWNPAGNTWLTWRKYAGIEV